MCVADPLNRRLDVFGSDDVAAAFVRAGHAFINAIMAGTPVVPPQISAVFSPGTVCQIETDNAAGQMQEQDMLSQNVQGYESDLWFRQGNHTA